MLILVEIMVLVGYITPTPSKSNKSSYTCLMVMKLYERLDMGIFSLQTKFHSIRINSCYATADNVKYAHPLKWLCMVDLDRQRTFALNVCDSLPRGNTHNRCTCPIVTSIMNLLTQASICRDEKTSVDYYHYYQLSLPHI